MQVLIPPILTVICAAAMLLLHWLAPLARMLVYPFNMLGWAAIIAGIGLGFVTMRRFRALNTNIHTFGEPGTLVTDGAFRRTRNPIYLGFATVLFGLWLLLGTLSPVVPLLVFVIIANLWYIPHEEARLEAKFGAQYREYKQRVRRWI